MFIVEKQREAKTSSVYSLLAGSVTSPWLSKPWTVPGVFQKEQELEKN